MFLFTLSLALRPCIIKSCRWRSTPNSMENTYKWTFIRTIPKCILTNDVFSFKMLIKKTVLVCRGGINRRFPHLNTFRSSRRHFIGHVVCGTRHFWGDRICLLGQGRGNFELSIQSSCMACKRTTVVCRCLLGTAYLQRKQEGTAPPWPFGQHRHILSPKSLSCVPCWPRSRPVLVHWKWQQPEGLDKILTKTMGKNCYFEKLKADSTSRMAKDHDNELDKRGWQSLVMRWGATECCARKFGRNSPEICTILHGSSKSGGAAIRNSRAPTLLL